MDELNYKIDLLTAMNRKLESSESMYRFICETSASAFLFFDYASGREQGYDIRTLGEWQHFFDFKVEHVRDMELIEEVYEEKYGSDIRELLFLEKKKQTYGNLEVKKKDVKDFHLIEVNVTYDDSGEPSQKVIRFRDITRVRLQNEDLKYMAYYDMTTGLYNRNYFIQLASGMLQRAKEKSETFSILFIDIDDFRKINDGFGMVVGDEVVQEFGQFLKTLQLDENVVVSHFSSDIYVMAIYAPCGNRSVENIHRLIQERCVNPFHLTNNIQLSLTCCVGVAEYPEASDNIFRLINFAEIVMFKAKKNSGKNSIQYFDDDILQSFLQNVEIEGKLKTAIHEKAFEIHYQPQFDLETGKLRGVEALVRMKEEDGSLISPGLFIPVAEKNGAIVPIGSYVLEESIKTYSELSKRYHIDFIMSINVSAIQYKKKGFIDEVLALLEKYEVAPEWIELELTESVLSDNFKAMVEKMSILRDYGIRVSLDDFGTGFSSLSYLSGLPIHTLKIDKSFIDAMLEDDASGVVLESIVSLMKKLGYETIAEGVEKTEQLNYLKNVGCDNIQGFLLGKPMKKEDLERVIIRSL